MNTCGRVITDIPIIKNKKVEILRVPVNTPT